MSIRIGKKDQLFVSDLASPTIYIYNAKGKKLSAFGEKGRYMTAQDTIPYTLYSSDTTRKYFAQYTKIREEAVKKLASYGLIFYDELAEILYRIYNTSALDVESKKYYVQVYKNEKLLADVPFLSMFAFKVVAIEKGYIWVKKMNKSMQGDAFYLYRYQLDLMKQ